MRIFTIVILSILLGLSVSARDIKPSKNIVTREVSISSFTELEASQVHVYVTIGSFKNTAKISAPDNLADLIVFKNKGSKLSIGLPSNINLKGESNIKIEISTPSVKEVEAELAALVNLRGSLAISGEIDLSASTSARIVAGRISAAKADLKAETSGVVSVQELNTTGDAEIDAETSAIVKIATLTCRNFDADAETSGKVRVNYLKADTLRLDTNTNGDVSIYGGSATNARLNADTASVIKVDSVKIGGGSVTATTGATIKCNIPSANIVSDTGATVTNGRNNTVDKSGSGRKNSNRKGGTVVRGKGNAVVLN